MKNKIKYKELLGLFKNIRRKQLYLLFICSLSILIDNIMLLQIQKLVDAIVAKNAISAINWLVLIMFLFGGVSFCLNTYQMKIWHTFSKYLENEMRNKMVINFFNKNISFVSQQSKGDLSSKLLNDGTMIAMHIGLNPIMIVINLFRILIIIFILSFFSFELVGIIVLLMPIYVISTILINGKMRIYSRNERESFGRLQGRLIEMINGFKEIKIFRKEDYFSKLFQHNLYNDYFISIKKVIKIQVTNTALSSYIKIIFPIIILWYGAYLSIDGRITVGMLVAFYTYITHLIEPMNNLGDIYQGTKQAYGAADRVYDFLFDQDNLQNRGNLVTINSIKKIDIQIDKFSINEHTILRNVKTSICDNDRLFIMGDSGSGKSTLINLLLKEYENFDGTIMVNDRDYLTISQSSYYKNMLAVFQEPLLFEGTIRENLTLGESYTDNQIDEVLNIVDLDDFMQDKNLDYLLKEGASNVSGGQKQRIAIARVLLRKPSILILDEATNGLDKNTEDTLIKRLDVYLENNHMKMICISHNDAIKKICNKQLNLSLK